jgi:chromate transporter
MMQPIPPRPEGRPARAPDDGPAPRAEGAPAPGGDASPAPGADASPAPGANDGPPNGADGAAAIFAVFLRLGLTSFGGPVAHVGFFHQAFVVRRQWLSEARFAELLALCQTLPGPASSQLGFALGLLRGGWAGAGAAFVGFTAPSALALAAFAGALGVWGGAGAGWLLGLKAAAAAAVALAAWGMARSLCPDRARQSVAVAAAVLAALAPGVAGQIAALALGACAGLALRRGGPAGGDGALLPVSRRAGAAALAGGAALALALPLLAGLGPLWALADGMFRAGALVFGGGHVVLPLLQAEVVETGLVSAADFLAGYGAAQAAPGPLFTVAAYLGMAAAGAAGALVATLAIFAPGFALLIGVAPFWSAVRTRPAARHALAGVNAAVVGLLLAALYDPVFLGGAASPLGFAICVAAMLGMGPWRLSPALIVAGAAGLGALGEASGLAGASGLAHAANLINAAGG